MNFDNLSPVNQALLAQALPAGQLVNVLYERGTRVEIGFERERRCFALGERGWLEFAGWEGEPAAGPDCLSRWTLTDRAQQALSR